MWVMIARLFDQAASAYVWADAFARMYVFMDEPSDEKAQCHARVHMNLAQHNLHEHQHLFDRFGHSAWPGIGAWHLGVLVCGRSG